MSYLPLDPPSPRDSLSDSSSIAVSLPSDEYEADQHNKDIDIHSSTGAAPHSPLAFSTSGHAVTTPSSATFLRPSSVPSDDYILSHQSNRSFELQQAEEDYFHAEDNRCPVKETIIALFLLLAGMTFSIIGIVHFVTGFGPYFAFFLIGTILILPGGYVSFQLFQAWRGMPGYSFAAIRRL